MTRFRVLRTLANKADTYSLCSKSHRFTDDELVEALKALVHTELDNVEQVINAFGPTPYWKFLEHSLGLPNNFPQDAGNEATKKTISESLKILFVEEMKARGLSEKILGSSKDSVKPDVALACLIVDQLMGDPWTTRVQVGEGESLEPELIRKAAREMILPPLSTPHNLEVNLMSLARFAAYVGAKDPKSLEAYLRLSGTGPDDLISKQQLLELLGFGLVWRESGFARLEVGHKLASALMFTDAPESVEAPWKAWSLILPDGIFGELPLRRVWCFGSYLTEVLACSPTGIVVLTLEPEGWKGTLTEGTREKIRQSFGEALSKEFERAIPLLQNLVRGCCLALSDPNDWKKDYWYGKPSGAEVKKASKHKELPRGERYVLGKPVQIDLREEVKNHVRGQTGGGRPSVLFLVRGHYTNQPYGPRSSLRKRIWLEPFWKGPEDARVLLRPYQAD